MVRSPSMKSDQTATHAPSAPKDSAESMAKALACAAAALDKKAENLHILHVGKVGGFTEYFVICSAMNDRQVQAIAESVSAAVKKDFSRPLGVEGLQDGRWVLIDLGDVVVHVFLDALREFYNLENFWATAPRIAIPNEFYMSSISSTSAS